MARTSLQTTEVRCLALGLTLFEPVRTKPACLVACFDDDFKFSPICLVVQHPKSAGNGFAELVLVQAKRPSYADFPHGMTSRR